MTYLLTQPVISQRRRYTRMLCTQQLHQIVGRMKPLCLQQVYKLYLCIYQKGCYVQKYSNIRNNSKSLSSDFLCDLLHLLLILSR